MLQLQSNVARQRQQLYQNMQQDEALSILNDFNEILQSEVYVDLDRLRILARHGIPTELRGVSSYCLREILFFLLTRFRRRFGNFFWAWNKQIDVNIL